MMYSSHSLPRKLHLGQIFKRSQSVEPTEPECVASPNSHESRVSSLRQRFSQNGYNSVDTNSGSSPRSSELTAHELAIRYQPSHGSYAWKPKPRTAAVAAEYKPRPNPPRKLFIRSASMPHSDGNTEYTLGRSYGTSQSMEYPYTPVSPEQYYQNSPLDDLVRFMASPTSPSLRQRHQFMLVSPESV